MNDLLSKIVDHYNQTKHIGPAKHDSSADKQRDGKYNKKKGDNSAVANPAIRDGAASTKKCQLCTFSHLATECLMFLALKHQGSAKRGEHYFQASRTKTVKGEEQRQTNVLNRANTQATNFALYAGG